MKRFLSVLLCLLLLFSLSFTVHAADMIHGEVRRMGEVIEKREKNSQTYKLSDGSYECVVYAEDKYFESQSGDLIEIDNSIIESRCACNGKEYAFSNAASDTVFRFSENEPSIMIEAANGSIAYSLIGSTRSSARIGGISAYQKLFEYQLSGKNCISYHSVQPQTDLVYSANNGTLKEYILLRGAQAPNAFRFCFDAQGFTVKPSENGAVLFINSKDEIVFELGKLFAVDAGGAYTDALRYSITGIKNDKIEITVSLSKEYLLAPERAFPVLIDPTITVTGASSTYDSFVAEDYPTSNFYLSTSLCTGKFADLGRRRSFVKFNLPTTINGDITRSYIRIKKNVGSAPKVRAYRVKDYWSASTITWSNKPSYSAENASAVSVHDLNNWYHIEATGIVKQWISGIANFGFLLMDNIEHNTSQWTSFYSSDAASPNKPELIINYVDFVGSRSFQFTPPRRYANCMGYALEFNQDIQILGYWYQYYGMTIAEFLAATKQKAEIWMGSNMPHSYYSEITSYDANIDSGYFRVVLRVGFEDKNNNGLIDQGERLDYHWRYQTNNNHGEWAEKCGGDAATQITDSNGVNPASNSWNNFYSSPCVYYRIKDVRSVDWYQNNNNNNKTIFWREKV